MAKDERVKMNNRTPSEIVILDSVTSPLSFLSPKSVLHEYDTRILVLAQDARRNSRDFPITEEQAIVLQDLALLITINEVYMPQRARA